MSTSVKRGPCGPCCSVAPVGTMTVWCVFRNASTSGFVISPRKTVGGFMSSGACGLDDGFHVGEVFFQRAAPGGGQAKLGAGDAAFESLVAQDVVRFFEL